MAITYVGGRVALSNSVTDFTTPLTLTGGSNAAPLEGDVVIVAYALGAVSDVAIGVTTAGYTELAELYANNTYDANLSVSWKRMTSTPDTDVTLSGTGSLTRGASIAIHVWRGVDATTPFDVTSTSAAVIFSALVNPTSISPVTTGAVILVAGGSAHIRGTTTFGATYLSNFRTRGADTTYDSTVGLGSIDWTSGSYDPAPWTFSATDSTQFSNASVTMALRPATDAVTINAPLSTLTLSPFEPSILSGVVIASPAVNTNLQGQAPTISLGVSLLVGSLNTAIGNLAPSVSVGSSVTIGQVSTVVAAPIPTVVVTSGGLSVPAASISVQALEPSVLTAVFISVGSVNTTVSSIAPVVRTGYVASTPAKETTLSVATPNIASGKLLSVPVVQVTVGSLSPSIVTNAIVVVPSSNLTITQYQPTIRVGVAVQPPAANLNIAPIAPQINTGVNVGSPLALIVIAGIAPLGVGYVSTRRTVSVTSDTSANAVLIETQNNSPLNNSARFVVLLETDNNSQINTSDNGVVLSDLHNQAI